MAKRTLAPIPEWFPRGMNLLRHPTLNKGTAFSDEERDMLGLRGLLPPHVSTQDEQVARILDNFHRNESPLARYIQMASLLDRNEALFFRVVTEYPDEMMPIIYTPTVGLACQKYAHIYRRPRGLFITARDRGRIAQIERIEQRFDRRGLVEQFVPRRMPSRQCRQKHLGRRQLGARHLQPRVDQGQPHARHYADGE